MHPEFLRNGTPFADDGVCIDCGDGTDGLCVQCARAVCVNCSWDHELSHDDSEENDRG